LHGVLRVGHLEGGSRAESVPVLREAQLVNGGQYLGPVGGRIVAQVMLGLLRADPTSYLTTRPSWRPHMTGSGGSTGGDYQIADFLRFAQVDPDSRGQ